MKTVLSPTIRARALPIRRLRQLVIFVLETEQMVAQFLHELFRSRTGAETGQGHVEGIAIDAYGFGKLSAAPLLIEAEPGPQYLTLYAEIVYRHDSPIFLERTLYGR